MLRACLRLWLTTGLLVVAASFTINPSLRKNLPFDPVRDFAPVSQLVTLPHILVVHPSLPVKSVKELVALAKAKPGELNFGSSGIATSTHLAAELFMHHAGIRMVNVPYKGGAPGMTALLSGEVHLYFATISTALPHIKVGKLRPLGVTSASSLLAASSSNVRTTRCPCPGGGATLPGRAASRVCMPASRAASSSRGESDTNNIAPGGTPHSSAMRA